ncbi:hypothetical protein COY05_00590 [Candidatus Peregrinibacteria bacterium CG_4_10_14_0_2_um_filter_38_24]|nr:MAG: hypothetical protein COY05_00590 [Candidatus Peregrinibacteria bacterium CG_4_10_14_0_2_um_filter_38_24]
MTTEEESSLFDRRMKLVELIILTITAIIIVISFTQIYTLIWPMMILGADLIFIIIATILHANKERNKTTFVEHVEATKIEISYKLQWSDVIGFLVYIFAIIIFGIFFSRCIN